VRGRRPGAPGIALVVGVVAAFACASARPPTKAEGMPGLVFPAHFAEGEERDAGAPDAEPAAPEPAKRSSSPPDPEPLRQAEQYEYTFAYESGATRVVRVRAMRFEQPVVTARKMGRFAFELWVGTELVERARFDFPLLAAEDPPPTRRRPLEQPPSLAGGVLKATVLVPASVRARRAVLVDRGTNVETELEWPPNLGGAVADAGVASDAGAPSDAGTPGDGGSPAKRTP
jgi:hypothetical protein